MNILSRYLLKEQFKIFILFTSCFYFLFVLIDYSSHMKNFSQEGISVFKVMYYYLIQFGSIAHYLLPVAFAVSVVKVLTTMNIRNEIIAMLSAGISYKKILSPLMLSGILCSLLLYLNFQFLYPYAGDRLQGFEDSYLKKGMESSQKVHQLHLKDGSLLIYQTYHAKKEAFFDVFWIKSADEFVKVKTLFPFEEIPRGLYIDYIVREKTGDMKKQESFDEALFPKMYFEKEMLTTTVILPMWQSFSGLVDHLSKEKMGFGGKLSDQEAKLVSTFYYKLLLPLLPFLLLAAISPFCLKFARAIPLFMIYAISLFGVIALLMCINASLILGENQVIPPFWALSAPFLASLLIFGPKYASL